MSKLFYVDSALGSSFQLGGEVRLPHVDSEARVLSPYDLTSAYGGFGQADPVPVPAPAPAPAPAPTETTTQPVDDLASTMVLHGAVGVLAGAACAPPGHESVWGAAGFVVGATLGQIGLVGLLAAALYMKVGQGGTPR